MVTYRFNLLGRVPEKDYKKTATKALDVARRASAVDTGKFRAGWSTRISGDFLFVTNSVRYAAPVELGSIIHKKHKHRVRNALLRMEIGPVQTSIGSTVIDVTDRRDVEEQATQPTVASLTPQEIRSPALVLNRLKTERVPTISKSQLFNRAFLTGAIAAARQEAENEDNQ